MKIDEASINHNAIRLISDTTEAFWDTIDDEKTSELNIARLGYIDGVLCLASELKKVLKE